MKSFIFFLFLVSITEYDYSQDFRKIYWGASKQTVMNSEPDQEWIESHMIGFKTRIYSTDVLVMFQFVNNKLVSAGYIFKENHTNKNEYIDDYNSTNEILREKYGTAINQDIWKNDLYKDNYQEWGTAISLGHYSKADFFFNETTEIGHVLSGDNSEITHLIRYISKEYKQSLLDQEKQEKLNAF